MKEQLEKVHQDLLAMAQSQFLACETELQEHLKNQAAKHSQAIEVLEGTLRLLTVPHLNRRKLQKIT